MTEYTRERLAAACRQMRNILRDAPLDISDDGPVNTAWRLVEAAEQALREDHA